MPPPDLKTTTFGLLPELLGYNLRRAQVAVFQDFAAAVAAHDITPGQFGVLVLIDRNAGLNQRELGEAMGVDRSTVVAVLDRLERRGLVQRRPVPTDRRSYALHLSPQGEALLAALVPVVRAHEDRIAADLSAAERDTLNRLLKKLNRHSAAAD
jgi:DNA-binding MarR family transcriptional regulator